MIHGPHRRIMTFDRSHTGTPTASPTSVEPPESHTGHHTGQATRSHRLNLTAMGGRCMLLQAFELFLQLDFYLPRGEDGKIGLYPGAVHQLFQLVFVNPANQRLIKMILIGERMNSTEMQPSFFVTIILHSHSSASFFLDRRRGSTLTLDGRNGHIEKTDCRSPYYQGRRACLTSIYGKYFMYPAPVRNRELCPVYTLKIGTGLLNIAAKLAEKCDRHLTEIFQPGGQHPPRQLSNLFYFMKMQSTLNINTQLKSLESCGNPAHKMK